VLPLDCGQEFDATRDEDFFAALPERPGVLLIEMKAPNAKPYLARTADIRRAAERLLRVPEALSKRLNLREVAARVRYRVTGSKFEQTLTLYDLAREYFPQRYRALLRLRPPAVLKVNLRNEYPRCYVTRSIRADGGFYLGPFASRRVAEAFAQGFLDLFKIRRCQIKIRRDPAFPGCIYSEMKMCLAPCFAGCTKEDYDVEVSRVVEALASAGESLTDQLQREREAASEALDFERASALHKRIEKVSENLRGMPEIARRIDDLNAVILQRAAEEKTVIVFPVLAGLLREPVPLRFGELASEPRSVEAILRAALEPEATPIEPRQVEPNANSESANSEPAGQPDPANVPKQVRRKEYGLRAAPPELPEHLSLVARWFYSKPRDGEIFFREADWPYRRILRACSRLLAPPEAQTPAPPAAPESPPPASPSK
jgi:excinuclease ABC subunit C